jgi:plasmid stabilization system protein ParE
VKAILREAALADLERIFLWIAQDSPANARSVSQHILDAIENRIAWFPHMGRKGRVNGTREWVVRGLPYIIVYNVDEARDAIFILGIFHGAKNLDASPN